MNPEQTKKLIDDIYATVDRAAVVHEVVGADNWRDMGGYITFRCPSCGQFKGYIHKPSSRHPGNTAQCSRGSCEMGQPMSLIDFVAGYRKARGSEFKRSVKTLAHLIGRDYGTDAYVPVSSERKKALRAKIAAQIPEGYYEPKPELEAPLKALRGNVNRKVVAYLESRGISYELAKAYEVGFAPWGQWPHKSKETGKPVRQWIQGRVVFPVRNHKGELMNLYGRALEDGSRECPKDWKHAFLPGSKGIGNQKDLKKSNVHITEGFFDFLSLMAARPTANASMVFGVHGFDWDLVEAEYICFCFDRDAAGEKWRQIADEGLEKGKRIYWLAPETYEGFNDLNQVWASRRRIDFKYVEYKRG